jgi:hypothetical protein
MAGKLVFKVKFFDLCCNDFFSAANMETDAKVKEVADVR